MKKSKAYHDKKHTARVERKAAKRKQTRTPYRAPKAHLPSLPSIFDLHGLGMLNLLALRNRAHNPYRRAA